MNADELELDKELKMAQIKHLEQMVAESQATVEKMREDFRIAEMERERQRKIDEEERKIRDEERKAFIKKWRWSQKNLELKDFFIHF